MREKEIIFEFLKWLFRNTRAISETTVEYKGKIYYIGQYDKITPRSQYGSFSSLYDVYKEETSDNEVFMR